MKNNSVYEVVLVPCRSKRRIKSILSQEIRIAQNLHSPYALIREEELNQMIAEAFFENQLTMDLYSLIENYLDTNELIFKEILVTR